jgi:hypothetical protein
MMKKAANEENRDIYAARASLFEKEVQRLCHLLWDDEKVTALFLK